MQLGFFKLVGLCFFVFSPQAGICEELHILEPEHVSFEYTYLKDFSEYPFQHVGVRDTYLDPIDQDLTFGLGINLNYNFFRYKNYKLFHRNNWGFDAVQDHVRHVWWKFDLGLNVYDKIEILHRHMSRHILEDTRPVKFPVRDEFVIRFILLDSRGK